MPISPSRILYEDPHLLAVDKRSGELVVKGSGTVEKLPLLDFLKKDYPGLRALHRLDFETSGVVLFARTKEAYEQVRASDFAGWKKIYSTLVMGRMPRPKGTIATPLPARNGKGTVEAVSHYTVLERFANSSFLDVEIETGRHHQIRKHLAEIGHPLALDDKYGHMKFNRLFTKELGFRKFFLHAKRVELPHPKTGEVIAVEAPLPKPFADLLRVLRSL
ncbi:hypothetical protein COU76_00425 [Candidatus Peregrinibacteria bacterium CG10_big_fil_rev_8_21_14_0_10_49_10]|nr:MAG: hypothetical protein COU76_00425 [Candidatus Peregrinibacteria bacterium CG10_big_fil_rev_8_21_14_0_10_49_10]